MQAIPILVVLFAENFEQRFVDIAAVEFVVGLYFAGIVQTLFVAIPV